MGNIPFEHYTGFRLPPEVQMKRVNQVIFGELSPCQREIIIAYYFQQKTIPQIAQERQVHKSTVCRTLHRAEAQLRKYLKY
jgi:RNA polymerase sigma factor (sigma-70 family)